MPRRARRVPLDEQDDSLIRRDQFIVAGRRERRVLVRVTRAAWRLRSAERERDWALSSARSQGVSIRKLASAAGLSASRIHQLLAGVDLDRLEVTLGQLREVGWPAPQDPDTGGDPELDRRDLIAERLDDEAEWLRRAAGWLTQLDAGGYPPVVNVGPSGDWPHTANVAVWGVPRILDSFSPERICSWSSSPKP